MISEETLKRTPLYQEHIGLKARMVPFGGWEMPVQYEGILAEYQQTRTSVTLFDTSHMGEFRIEGDCRAIGLDRLVTMPIADMSLKTCRYGMLLNEAGGVIDDLIVFREGRAQWFLVVNGATRPKDAAHIQEHLKPPASFQDISAELGKIDVQGPLSRDVLKTWIEDIGKLKFYTFDYFLLFGERVLISRTGYTGELGYEIYYPASRIRGVWHELLKDKRVKPAGLGARDMLRLEMGYSLYGHELNEEINPLEAGLERFVDFSKEFIGKEALLKMQKEGVQRASIGIISETRRSPREGQTIFEENGAPIGKVTSGTFSPACQKGIGLGMVSSGYVQKKRKIYFGDDKNKNNAMMTGKMFYRNGSLKS